MGCRMCACTAICGSRSRRSRIGWRQQQVVTKRGKKYGVRVYDAATGRKEWVGTFATLREARDAERERTRRGRRQGTETCGSFARRWVADYPRPASATVQTYTYAIQAFARD